MPRVRRSRRVGGAGHALHEGGTGAMIDSWPLTDVSVVVHHPPRHVRRRGGWPCLLRGFAWEYARR